MEDLGSIGNWDVALDWISFHNLNLKIKNKFREKKNKSKMKSSPMFEIDTIHDTIFAFIYHKAIPIS